jgi:hypothetical protein
MMFYVIDKNTGERVEANGFWAVGESGQLYDVIDGWGCEGGGGSSNAPSNFIVVFGAPAAIHAEPDQEKVACGVCGKLFKNDEAMQQHRSMKHFAIHARQTPVPFPGYPPVKSDRRLLSAPHCPECGHPDCNGQCYGDDMMGFSG